MTSYSKLCLIFILLLLLTSWNICELQAQYNCKNIRFMRFFIKWLTFIFKWWCKKCVCYIVSFYFSNRKFDSVFPIYANPIWCIWYFWVINRSADVINQPMKRSSSNHRIRIVNWSITGTGNFAQILAFLVVTMQNASNTKPFENTARGACVLLLVLMVIKRKVI